MIHAGHTDRACMASPANSIHSVPLLERRNAVSGADSAGNFRKDVASYTVLRVQLRTDADLAASAL